MSDMRVKVISVIPDARPDDFIQKTAIVIDVLRATSNMAVALSSGCRSILPVETVHAAAGAKRQGDILGGERHCRKIPGFQMGNSPTEYLAPEVAGKRIILTTTNGTRALQKARASWLLMAGSLLNAKACARTAMESGRDLTILCAGTRDEFALEDGIGAGLILEELMKLNGEHLTVNDFGKAMLELFHSIDGRLEENLLTSDSGVRLSKLGFGEDIRLCAQVNKYRLVPILRNGELVSHHVHEPEGSF